MSNRVNAAAQLQSLRSEHTEVLAEAERYRLLVESVQDYAIFLLDPEGYVLTWNKGAEKNKGYKAHEIIGKHFSTFYLQRDKDAGKPERELELAKRFGRVEDEDWRVRKDGSRFWANVVITALHDQEGRLMGFAKVTRDLTDRKRHEESLRETNELLKHQQGQLEQLNRDKDEFISLASHQLRTPATSTKQFLGLLLEGFAGELPPEQLAFVRKAYESNEHQIAVVNNLLRVAQVDDGRVLLQCRPTDIRALLMDVVDAQRETFAMRDQQVAVKIAPELGPACVDAGHFRMALENLVDNASKYTPPAGKVTIWAREQNGSLVITIQDTGVGIATGDVSKLFKKFSRIHNDLSATVGGSGLGLYWVSKIIAMHGGKIDVVSAPHKGTSFTIRVPLGAGQDDA